MHLEHPRIVGRERRRLRAQVGLVEDDDLRPVVEPGTVEPELAVDRREPLVGVGLRPVDDVDEEPRALEVGEELVAEAHALARAFDQTGNVGDGELAAVGRLDGAEHGLKRRERVVGDLRGRVRDPPEERRLARVREPGERCVRDQLETKLERELRTRQPDLCEARCLPCRCREAGVPPATGTAARDDDALRRAREVGHELAVRIVHLRPDRHGELHRRAVGTVLSRATPVAAPTRSEHLSAAQRGEVAQRRVGDQRHVSPVTAVTAVRPAPRDELLAPKAEAAVTASTRADDDVQVILEHDARGRGASR